MALVSALLGGCTTERAATDPDPARTGAGTGSAPGGANPTIPAPSVTADPRSTTVVAPVPADPVEEATPAPTAPEATADPGSGGPVAGVPAVPTAPAAALLAALPVGTVDPLLPDYRRVAFGDGWTYDRSSGCNVRELVLITESRTAPVMGPRCKPLSGDWVSAYDGVVTSDPADLEIDHLVPLAEAWRTGAATWTPERREAFANDLDDPATLIAVTGRSNRSKGDSPPDRWLPEVADGRCPYVEGWIRVKARWGLRVSPAEKVVLVQVLSGC